MMLIPKIGWLIIHSFIHSFPGLFIPKYIRLYTVLIYISGWINDILVWNHNEPHAGTWLNKEQKQMIHLEPSFKNLLFINVSEWPNY